MAPHPGHERPDRSGQHRSPAVQHPPSSAAHFSQHHRSGGPPRFSLARRKSGVQIPSPPPHRSERRRCRAGYPSSPTTGRSSRASGPSWWATWSTWPLPTSSHDDGQVQAEASAGPARPAPASIARFRPGQTTSRSWTRRAITPTPAIQPCGCLPHRRPPRPPGRTQRTRERMDTGVHTGLRTPDTWTLRRPHWTLDTGQAAAGSTTRASWTLPSIADRTPWAASTSASTRRSPHISPMTSSHRRMPSSTGLDPNGTPTSAPRASRPPPADRQRAWRAGGLDPVAGMSPRTNTGASSERRAAGPSAGRRTPRPAAARRPAQNTNLWRGQNRQRLHLQSSFASLVGRGHSLWPYRLVVRVPSNGPACQSTRMPADQPSKERRRDDRNADRSNHRAGSAGRPL